MRHEGKSTGAAGEVLAGELSCPEICSVYQAVPGERPEVLKSAIDAPLSPASKPHHSSGSPLHHGNGLPTCQRVAPACSTFRPMKHQEIRSHGGQVAGQSRLQSGSEPGGSGLESDQSSSKASIASGFES